MTLSATKVEPKSDRAAQDITAGLAALCKAAADPLRLLILRVLSHDSFGVQELATIFAMPQPGMSHHLKVLAKAGLLVSRREGNSIFYRPTLLRADQEYFELLSSLFQTCRQLPLEGVYAARIDKIYEERSMSSRLYFERNADKFEENQGQLAELTQYLPNLKEILDLLRLPKQSRVMEVGPGQGVVLKELAKRYDHLVALDNSGEMLARAKGQAAGLGSVQFVQSSLEAYEPKARFDAVVLNMVLHHMPSPQQAWQKLSRLVKKGGVALIADLCSHNQEWARASCGDVWLGFDPQDLREWAAAAGFTEEQSLYLGLKNGFQIQMKLFRFSTPTKELSS